ncbi:Prefoldin beta-like protein [Conidiobolus coronatus NRRL 28638]|uniref:Prefoldin beta-like protein n=1 Tax=Conidiobolus coronatus (strain ATCC 28846 / CBS 209.66 / NRRL 28638) TaxID=796925 RepID=A0A137PDB3_CONC2|nr:Prefoldin beta-like protein [Conidiobolus coronatus NRRL 28638]|eukprot:KXN72980.1 Prefoldin beta-like protein [Conidiobolus coronatus NRRL 28638]
MSLVEVKKELEVQTKEFQNLQNEFSKIVQNRNQLEAQLKENEAVKKEFSVLNEDNKIYKLIGPGLIEQDMNEAKTNVDKRIDFIQSEIIRVELKLTELSKVQEEKKVKIIKLQNQVFQDQQQKGQA